MGFASHTAGHGLRASQVWMLARPMMRGSEHIEKTDYAFWSKGCQPWERLTDK
jgi:hypothetical protein